MPTDSLTTVTSIANGYAYFSLNEKSLLNFTRDIPDPTLQAKLTRRPNVRLVADGSRYKQTGRVETATARSMPPRAPAAFGPCSATRKG